MNKFQIIQPSAQLAPYIKQYWFLTLDNLTSSCQRLVPLGYSALCIHRGNRTYSSNKKDYLPQSYFYGIATRHTDLTFSGYIDFICIIFQPTGTSALFKIPLDELKDSYASLNDLNDAELLSLKQQLKATTDNSVCAGLIEQYLLHRIYQINTYEDKRINTVINAICKGENDINRLAETACLSYKQFKRIFGKSVGTNPKDYLRIIRFQKLHHLLQIHADMTLEQLAYECGYYDKSHLIKEVKDFSGFTPTELIEACEPIYSDYHSLFRSAFIDLSYK